MAFQRHVIQKLASAPKIIHFYGNRSGDDLNLAHDPDLGTGFVVHRLSDARELILLIARQEAHGRPGC